VDAPWPAAARLAEFVAAGRHGTMDWMETTAERRAHPTRPVAGRALGDRAGLNYGPDRDPLAALKPAGRGAISVYAQGATITT
jgi:epoxyqueuosine reductase